MKKLLLLLLIAPIALSAQDFWTETIPFPTTVHHVADISIVDESTVWVTGTDLDGPGNFSVWRWARSTDGGVTWTNGALPDDVIYPHMSAYYMTNIAATSDQTAYIGAARHSINATNKLLVTHDAGATWTQIHPELFSDSNSFLCGVHFFDTNHGIVFGDPVDNYFEIYTTTDAGVTWTRTTTTDIPAPLVGEYIMINHFDTTGGTTRFLTNQGRLFCSQDQGMTWTVKQTPANPYYDRYGGDFYSDRYFSFKNANEGIFVTAGNSALYRTIDGGTTWNPSTTTGILSDRSVAYVPQTTGTYYNTGHVSEDGAWSSGYSTDNGNSWTVMTDNPNFIPVVAEFFSPTVGYASGYHYSGPHLHGFYRLTDTFDRLLKKKSFLETSFNASPNPTKDVFKINGASITFVKIHDATGKAIYQQSFSATDEAEIDLSGFGTGIYFAKVNNYNGSKTIKIIKN